MTNQGSHSLEREGPNPSPESEANACPHKVMLPRWDSVEDMGNEAKATGYKCDACGAELTLEEAAHAKDRLGAISL